MSKQTAVDLFHDGIIDLLRNASVNSNTVAMLWMKCKPVEREQIEEAYGDGINAHRVDFCNRNEYYERTYGKEAGNANG